MCIFVLGVYIFPCTKILHVFKVVPHITDAIQEWIERVALVPVDGLEGPADVCVIELGGTIGTDKLFFLEK
jgi:CTP synthase (UTP-ammonia lyase)